MTPDVQISPDGLVLINGKETEEFGNCSRSFYRTENFIIKVDEYIPESTNEIEIWDILDEEDRPHFVPILYGSSKEGWICQEYLDIIEAISLDQEVRLELWITIIEPLCKRYGLRDVCGMHNWGLVDGTPMIYDYGQ